MIPLRTGNLSVSTFKAVWHGQPRPDPSVDRARLPDWRAAGFSEVEDYVAWCVVEPEPGRWDFALHRDNLDAADAAGLATWIYPWLHLPPRWWLDGRHDDGAPLVPSRCAMTGRAGYFPSLFAEATWTRLERYWAAVHEALGARVAGVAIAWPADYGEVGAASDISRWLFPHRPDGPLHRSTVWAGDEPARAALVEWLEEAHGSLASVAERWGVNVTAELSVGDDGAPPPFPTPTIARSEALRVDVAAFLRSSTRGHLDRMLRLARDVFGDLPLEVKLGHASESILLGRTMRDVVDIAAGHDVTVRSTHSGQAPVFHKHIAALCRRAGATFATEGPRDVDRIVLARRVHDDVAHGTAHVFEFPEQLDRLALASAAEALGSPPRPSPVAAVWPTLDLALQPGLGVPEVLTVAADTFRRVVDFDLVDDESLRDLDGSTRALLWLDGHDVAASTYDAIADWVDDGGALIVGTPGAPRVCDAAGGPPLGTRGAALRDALTRHDAARAGLSAEQVDALPEASDGAPDGVVRSYAQPGEELDRLLVGEGWHGRDDGAFGWPDATSPHPTRWTAARARLRLPAVTDACETRGVLVLDATIRGMAPETVVVVWWNDEPIGRVRYPRDPGPVHLPAPPPRAGVANLVTLSMPTTRPPAHGGIQDVRDLGILVREVRWVGLESPGDEVGGLGGLPGVTIRERPRERAPEPDPYPPVPFGRGTVFPGDTTPAGALDALRAWLADDLAAPPSGDDAPPVVRCADASCLVSPLRDGVILHNPSHRTVTPRVIVHGEGPVDVGTLHGYATRFVAWPRA